MLSIFSKRNVLLNQEKVVIYQNIEINILSRSIQSPKPILTPMCQHCGNPSTCSAQNQPDNLVKSLRGKQSWEFIWRIYINQNPTNSSSNIL